MALEGMEGFVSDFYAVGVIMHQWITGLDVYITTP
jgi:hypothetical protein